MKRVYVHWKCCCLSMGCVLSMTAALVSGSLCFGQSLPPSTAIPVQFTQTIQAGKVAPGTRITARVTQTVMELLPKGTVLEGRVTGSRAFVFNPAPHAVQEPSYLSIHFERAIVEGREIPVNVHVRALADNLDAYDASYPHRLGDSDHFYFMQQIGGDQYSLVGKTLLNSEGDVVGSIHEQGVVGKLIPTAYANHFAGPACNGTQTQQALGIFSPSACGLYGFASVELANSGREDGTVRLESFRRTVKLYAGSAALLEVN